MVEVCPIKVAVGDKGKGVPDALKEDCSQQEGNKAIARGGSP